MARHLSLKLGMGGEGLQPYDDKGQYAEVAVSVFGKTARNFDEFVEGFFRAKGQWDAYNAAPANIKEQIRSQLRVEYDSLLEDAVEELNQRDSVYRRFFPMGQGLDGSVSEIFGKSFADEYMETKRKEGSTIEVDKNMVNGIRVSTACYALQKLRYPRNKFRPMSDEEFDQEAGNAYSTDSSWMTFTTPSNIAAALGKGQSVIVYRGLHDIEESRLAETHRGYVDTDSSTCQTVLGNGLRGTGTYMTVCHDYAVKYARKTDDLFHPDRRGMVSACLVKAPPQGLRTIGSEDELYTLRKNVVAAFSGKKEEIRKNLIADGMSEGEASAFVDEMEKSLGADSGLCAMVAGYDACINAGMRHCVLVWNPSVVYTKESFEEVK